MTGDDSQKGETEQGWMYCMGCGYESRSVNPRTEDCPECGDQSWAIGRAPSDLDD